MTGIALTQNFTQNIQKNNWGSEKIGMFFKGSATENV